MSFLLLLLFGATSATDETNTATACAFEAFFQLLDADFDCERCGAGFFNEGVCDRRQLSHDELVADEPIQSHGQEDRHMIQMNSIADVSNGCWHEDYNLSLIVNGHLFLAAIPANEQSSCPPLLADARFMNDAGGFEPHMALSELSDDMVGPILDSAYPLGAFPLEELLLAFDTAVVSADTSYDIMSNNCATFVLSVLSQLQLEVDQVIITYTVDKLLESETVVGMMVEGMDQVPRQGHGLRNMGTRAMVEIVVQQYVQAITV